MTSPLHAGCRVWLACSCAAVLLSPVAGCRETVILSLAPGLEQESRGARERGGWQDRPETCEEEGEPLRVTAEWDGTSFDRAFIPSKSGRLRMEMPQGGEDGWVLFGNHVELPEPAHDQACYPTCAFTKATAGNVPSPIEGFLYPLRYAEGSAGARIRLEYDRFAPWDAWCRAQPPHHLIAESFACAPLGQVSVDGDECLDATGQPGDLDECCMEILCHEVQVCSCDAEECRARDAKGWLDVILYPVRRQIIAEVDSGGLFLLDARPVSDGGDAGAGDGGAGTDGSVSLL